MKILEIEVIDLVKKQIIGLVKIQLRLYFKQNNEHLYRRGQKIMTDIEVDGLFPIIGH